MNDKPFVDTNVLVYAHDRGAGLRHGIARDLVDRLWLGGGAVISTQVLQELWVNVRRKAVKPIPRNEAERLIQDYLAWDVVVNDGTTILGALQLERRFSLSFWDALIVQAALDGGATVLYSEDMGDRQRYDSLRVINPFSVIVPKPDPDQ